MKRQKLYLIGSLCMVIATVLLLVVAVFVVPTLEPARESDVALAVGPGDGGSDPLVGFSFRLEKEGQVAGYFTECAGIGSEQEVIEHVVVDAQGNEFTHKIPGILTYTDVTLKRGITSDTDLWTWRKQVEDGQVVEARVNVSIIMMDQAFTDVARWDLAHAWPRRITAPASTADSSGFGIEEIEIVCDRMERISITSQNQPPVAHAGGPYEADEGTAIIFDASSSSDPDGDELNYRWDFDSDGTWDTTYSTNPTATYIWDDEYSGIVIVEVFDGQETDTDFAAVTVNNVAPSVEAGPDQTVDEGNPVSFSGSFTDPGTGDTHTVEWDFGDGSPPVTGTLTPTHTYGDNGVYTVTLTVTDDDVSAGSDTLTVTVLDLTPIADFSWSPEPQNEGSPVNFTDLSTSYPDNIIAWDWDFAGLGTSSEQNPNFSFMDDGIYPITLTVTDDDGSTDTVMHTVIVLNVAPNVADLPDQTVYSGEGVNLMAPFTDPGTLDHPWGWEIDWGDGTIDTGSTDDQSTLISSSHTYLAPDNYYVKGTVRDKDGGYGEDELTITVKKIPVDIDVKPGSWPNSLNLNGNGSVPVGIFGSPEFNVHDIDKSTVRFGLNGLEAIPVHKGYCGHVEDLNEDGIDDIVFHFREGELGIPVDTEGNTELTLFVTGQLDNGIYFEGTDIVRITPNNENSRGKGGKGPK